MADKATPLNRLLDLASEFAKERMSVALRKVEVPELLKARPEAQLMNAVKALDFRGREFVEQGSDRRVHATPVVLWTASDPGAARNSARDVVLLSRALMSSQEATEMRLWVVGPVASSTDAAWEAARAEIERDSLGCSKSVWLPGADPEKWSEEMTRFLQRTFLARPWHVDSAKQSSGQLLDDVATSLRSGQSPKEDAASLVDTLLELKLDGHLSDGDDGGGSPEDGSDQLDPLCRAVLTAVEAWLDDEESDDDTGATP